MIKKTICLILSLICFAGLMTVPAAAEESSTRFEYIQMTDMGFLSDEEDPDYIITRGEFAEIICRLCKLEPNGSAIAGYTDLSAADEYYDSIQLAYGAGIMIGYSDGSFRPEEPLTVGEAVKVLVEIAGYENVATAYGGFTKGHIEMADKLKLMKNTGIRGYTGAIKRQELGIMLYNLMIAPVNDIAGMGEGKIGYKMGDEAFSEKYHGLVHISDIVTANSYTNFSKTVMSIGESKIVVGDKMLEISDFTDRFLVGRYVSVFYDEETDKIVSIVERTDDEEVIEIMSDDIAALYTNGIMYHNGVKNKRISFTDETAYIYNDKMVLSYDFTTLSTAASYRLTVIDNNDDGNYDVVFIENYYTVVAGLISSDMVVMSKLFDAVGTGGEALGKQVNIDDRIGTVYILDKGYKKYESKEIVPGDVLTVIENPDYKRIMLSRESSSITIDSVEVSELLIHSGEEELRAVDELKKLMEENKLVGAVMTVYTDIFGYVAYIAEAGGTDVEKCGLLISSAYYDSDDISIMFKILTSDGEQVKLYAAERIRINDVSYRTQKLSMLPDVLNGTDGQPILYTLSEDGRIKQLTLPKTVLSGNDDGFFLGGSVSSVTFSNSQKTFGGRIEVGDETISFVLPGGTYDPDTSEVLVGNAKYDSTRQYTVDGYYRSKNNDTADIIVVKTNLSTANYNTPVAVITSVSGFEEYNDEICRRLEYLSAGSIKTAYISDTKTPTLDISAIGAGDTVRLSVDLQNYVSDLVQLYDYDSEQYMLSSNPTSNNFNDSLVIGWGYVARNSNGRIRVSPTKNFTMSTTVFGLPMHILSGYDLMMVESEFEISKCTAADINVGDKVVHVVRGGTGKAIVVYK